MPNLRLSKTEIEEARLLLTMVRTSLGQLAGDDHELLFALRRKVYKELVYDERSKPAVRRKLKDLKRQQQGGLCSKCSQQLPLKYCILDRFVASSGYTVENTQLICSACDVSIQQSRTYS